MTSSAIYPRVRVGEVADSIQYGFTASAREDREGVRFLRITDIQNGKVDWTTVPSCDTATSDIDKYQLRSGDLVFARTGASTGKSFLIDDCPPAIFASYLIRVRPSPRVDPRYLANFFQSSDYWQQIESGKRGIGQPNVNATTLASISLPLPMIAEQRRIVAEIEKQFTRLDSALADLSRVRSHLKLYRSSLLERAVSNGGAELTLRELAADEPNAVTDGPFGSKLKTEHYTESGPRVIRLQNIGEGVFRDERAHISSERFQDLRKHQVFPGDVVIAAFGADPPRSCLIPQWLGPAIVKADCIRFKPDPELVDARYVNIALNSPTVRHRTKIMVHGVGRPRLNLGEIKSIVIPVPRLTIQTKIVEETDRRLADADRVDSTVRVSEERAKALRESVLQKAFSGQL